MCYEEGFSLAGEPMTNRRQREFTVRPQEVKQDKYIVPVSDGVDDCEAEQDEGGGKQNGRKASG